MSDQKKLIEYATGAKNFLANADVDPVQDENLMRAAVAFHMLERDGKLKPLDEFERSHAIAIIASNFDDRPPSTPARAALFATVLEDA